MSLKPILVALAITTATASAQNTDSERSIPQITVTGHGEVRVTPDRATVQVGVQSRASTAAAAAAENAKKQAGVIAAIRSLGVDASQISTTSFSVNAEQRYEPNRDPVVTGYVVTNTVVVDVQKISQVGSILDAALAHGANLISSLNFYSSNTESSRGSAIALAVAAAKADADAAARAAGGSLGPLLEIAMSPYSPPGPRPMMMRAAVASAPSIDTPIAVGEQTVAVDVSTRWRFVPKM
jgi:uncharacterized protein YggE